jgi:hypothetical protein
MVRREDGAEDSGGTGGVSRAPRTNPSGVSLKNASKGPKTALGWGPSASANSTLKMRSSGLCERGAGKRPGPAPPRAFPQFEYFGSSPSMIARKRSCSPGPVTFASCSS